ncbi:hypothetical protein GCK72_007801 [Caenorhabditis remanei]|uniref:F-box associated domain-containing protein n=1 Tax=Caenorhabditis remanei TaxID=31234 RepID=A0A6A5HPV0_CAERE|nr:hypothetical protein GCK72_007801 [Caenorhabditis remanei]KAF1767842.1 hypothetical protein GCK72_007801 [Caenorhabditis remanei]
MKNTVFSRNKPLSYDASKTVVKSLSLEIREQIHHRIPSLRAINSLFPFWLEKVKISNDTLVINNRKWTVGRRIQRENEMEPVIDETEVSICLGAQRAPARRLNQSPDDVFEQLFDAYIRNGTVVRGALTLVGIPAFLKKKNSDELKIKVTNLELPTQNGSTEDYEQLRRFIDLKALRSVMMIENSAANKISSMLEKPEIKTCEKLTLTLSSPSIDPLFRLRNQHLWLHNSRLSIDDLDKLVENWIITGREIGTRFSLYQTQYVDSIFERLKQRFGAIESKHPEHNYYTDGVTIKMGDDRRLVIFAENVGDSEVTYHDPWVFEMEVMASASATGIMGSEEVV